MIKTKPAGHIKRNDKLVFRSANGDNVYVVAKVSDVDYDERLINVTFPAVYEKTVEGYKIEKSPKSSIIFARNEQVSYKE